MRSGADYVERLRDGRQVFLDGELVRDVTRHPAFAPAIDAVARGYDHVREAAVDGRGATADPDTGELRSDAWLVPGSSADLGRRRTAHELWAEVSYGLMGRTPDHVAAMLAAFRGSLDVFARGGQQFSDNVERYYDRVSGEDLYVAYVIVPPQVDRSKPAHQQLEPFLYAGVCRETDDGVVVRGAQMIGTSAAIADELFLSYVVPLVPGDEDYAISCAMPVDSPGLRLHPRRPYAPAATSSFDYPLSSRFDESDSLAVFDDVLVPWENVFVHRNVDLVRDQFYEAGAHQMTNFQSLVRLLVKLRFASGLAARLVELHGIGGLPPVQATLGGQIAILAEQFEALVIAAQTEPRMRGGLACPNPRFIYTGMALHRQAMPELIRQLRELAGGAFLSVPSSVAAFDSPLTAADTERYYGSAGASARERVAFLRLMWDFVGSEFASRQLQYEMFYSAAQHVSDLRVFRYFDWGGARALVDACLAEPDPPTAL